MQKNQKHPKDIYRYGFIISLFISLFSYIGTLVRNSFIVGLLTDYRSIKKQAENSKSSGIVSIIRKLKFKTLNMRLSCARLSERSLLVKAFDSAGKKFFNTCLQSVGVFLLTAGAVIVTASIAERNESLLHLKFSDTFILGVVMVMCSLLFIFRKDKSISMCIRESRFLSYFFVDILYLKHLENEDCTAVRKASAYSFILGVAFGSVSYSVSPILALFIVGIVAYLYLVFTKPENGILLICMQLPVLAEELLLFLITITVVSLVFKLVRGKRSMSINLCSVAAVVMGLIFISCTVFSFDREGTLMQSVPFIAAVLLTICVIMTVKSTSLADKCFRMLGMSTSLSVLFGLSGTFLSFITDEVPFSDMLSIAMNNFTGSFDTPVACAAFLIIMVPFFIINHPLPTKIFSFPALAIVLLGLFLCSDYYAIVSIMAAILISLCVFGRHRMLTAVIAIVAWITVDIGIPAMLHRSSIAYNVSGFRSVKQLVEFFGEHAFAGCGMGTEAIAHAGLGSGINASHIDKSFGVYMDISMRFGIPLIVICFIIILLFISKTVSYGLTKQNPEPVRSKCAALFMSITAAGIYALYSDYIYDFRILALLFLIFGLSSAIPDSADADYIPKDIIPEYDTLQKE